MTNRAGTVRALARNLLLALGLAVFLFPIYLVLVNSLKSNSEITVNKFGLAITACWDNYAHALDTMHFGVSLWNTFYITFVSCALVVVLSAMASYAIDRRGGKAFQFVYYMFLARILVPFQFIMLPLYRILKTMRLISNHTGVILLYVAGLCPFTIFLMTGFLKSIPRQLDEAAFIDGASKVRCFARIILPLLKPVVVTVVILNAISVWNDYLMPMLFLQSAQKRTLTVSLANFQGAYSSRWNLLMAGIVLISLPMCAGYLAAQKHIIAGITAGSVKG